MPKYIEEKELREWVQNWFEKNRYYHPYSKSNDIPIPELYDILEQMPSADVRENVHARWVKVGQSFLNPNRFLNYACSKCGFDIEQKKFNFCPNCGAQMEANNGEIY